MGTVRGAYIYRRDPRLLVVNEAILAARPPGWTGAGMPGGPRACGTPAGYRRHKRAGERACEACRHAMARSVNPDARRSGGGKPRSS